MLVSRCLPLSVIQNLATWGQSRLVQEVLMVVYKGEGLSRSILFIRKLTQRHVILCYCTVMQIISCWSDWLSEVLILSYSSTNLKTRFPSVSGHAFYLSVLCKWHCVIPCFGVEISSLLSLFLGVYRKILNFCRYLKVNAVCSFCLKSCCHGCSIRRG